MQRSRKLRIYATLVVLLTAAYFVTPISHEVALRGLNLAAAHARSEMLVTLTLTFLSSAILVYFAFPAMPIAYMAAGYCMGFWSGGLTVLIGSTIGGLGAFMLFRSHIPDRHRLSGHDCKSISMWFTLLGLRLSPVVPAPLVNIFAAAAGVSPVQHLTTTMLGSAPLILFYAMIGQQGYLSATGEIPHWWQFWGCVIIFLLSTALSLLGPWRAVLKTVHRLKEEALHSFKGQFTRGTRPAAPESRFSVEN
jgi:uncharacterized membrane protein YdjX (TVP38/TMEM64 family)